MRFLRLPEVQLKTELRKPTIYKRMGNGTFPRSIGIGGGKVAWLENEVEEWMRYRIAETRESQ